MREKRKDIKIRIGMMMAGIVGMGIFLSFLIGVDYGTESSSFMNLALAERFDISFGTMMLLTNALFFIPVVFLEPKLIHIGTVANMVLIGYISDFCQEIWARCLPSFLFTEQPYRTIVFVAALFFFLVSVAFYMNADIGQAPYDAVPTIISHRLHLPFFAVRVSWDFTVILIGILAGKRLSIATVVFAFTIGPAVSVIGAFIRSMYDKKPVPAAHS